MRLAEAALHVTAEDDAIASHSTVPFPVPAWVERIERLADQLEARNLRRAAAAVAVPPPTVAAAAAHGGSDGGADGGGGVAYEAAAALRAVERFLFEEVGFRMPDYGRSNLPPNCLVDHPGVWEEARVAYLHETLIRRQGHPATLGLLLGEVCGRLLARGALPCAAAVDTRGFVTLPRAVPLPQLGREMLTAAAAAADGGGGAGGGGAVPYLNTTTSEVLVEMLRHLKRAYWPFSWDSGVDAAYPGAVGSHGGFRAAAKAAVGEEGSAALAAVAKVAAWRLERGIWTSPGAGDLRRARAAAERLVLLAGERCPEERRDLAVLLLHCGEPGAAAVELRAYLRAVAPRQRDPTATTVSSTPAPWLGRGLEGPGALARGPDPFDIVLCRRLLALLGDLGAAAAAQGAEGTAATAAAVGAEGGGGTAAGGGAGGAGGVWEEPAEPLSVESTLRATPPWLRPDAAPRRPLPLTW